MKNLWYYFELINTFLIPATLTRMIVPCVALLYFLFFIQQKCDSLPGTLRSVIASTTKLAKWKGEPAQSEAKSSSLEYKASVGIAYNESLMGIKSLGII
jgi:hypothetical protein